MSTPRSLADAVRAMSTEQLEQLLDTRPDLTHPRPRSLGELAERAAGAPSARLAVEALDAWQRRVALALAAVPEGESLRRVAALMQADRAPVEAAASVLCDRALAWGTSRTVRLTQGARQALGPFPAGLAPASPVPMDDAAIDAALAEGGADVRALLDRLLWELPVGQVRDADRRGSGDSPADRALALKLLRPREAHTAILPREVSLRLRGGRLFEHPVPASVPAWPAPEAEDAGVMRRLDNAGLGAAFELVRHVELVVDEVALRPMRPLASGGLAKKDAAALFRLVGRDADGWLVVQLAHAAGLMASSGQEWLPTVGFDHWAAGDDWSRWRALLTAWVSLGAWPEATPLLAPASAHGWSTTLRGEVLRQLRHVEVGTRIDAERLTERLEWLHPAWRSETLPDLCVQALDELTRLGVLALGRRTALLDATDDPGFPEQVERFLVQGDLTAISPGPLTREVGQVLNLLASRESTGGAGVHRFTAESIRRALDAGWSAEDIREWVAEHSDTGMPQPLTYLIDDVARRHGAVQVSAVSSVVTVDDPALAEALLNDPRAHALALHRIAGGVLGSLAEPDEVVDLLRSLGHAPVARDASGSQATTPAGRRARPSRPPAGAERPSRAALHRLAEDLRAREDPAVHASGADDVLGLLGGHLGDDTWLEVDHVLDDGTPRTLVARALAITSGMVRLQPREGPPTAVALARIVGVRVPKRLTPRP